MIVADWQGVADRLLPFRLVSVRVWTWRRHRRRSPRPGRARRCRHRVRLGDIAGAIDVDSAHRAAEEPAQVHDRAGAVHGVATSRGSVMSARSKPNFPTWPERLNEIGLAVDRGRDPDPDPALKQVLANVSADESATAEDGYKLFRRARSCVAP